MGFFYPQWQKIIRIGVTTPPTTTGYQVKVEIPWQPGMRDDFADLRFSDYYRILPYWIETSTTRSTATVWVKLTEVNTAANEFFCYYGNGGASSESNGDNVFEFFDDFLGSALDTTKWTQTTDPATTLEVSNSELHIINTHAAVSGVYATTSFGVNYTITARWKPLTTGYSYPMIGSDSRATGGTDRAIAFVHDYSGTRYYWLETTAVSTTSTRTSLVNDGLYHVITISRNGTTSVIFTIGTTTVTNTVNVPSGSIAPSITSFYSSTSGEQYVDWFAVRKYQSTEPTCTPAESGINTAFYQALLRAKHVFDVATYPYTLAVSFVTDHMHLTWTEP